MLRSLQTVAANVKQAQITCIVHRARAITLISGVSRGQYRSPVLGFYVEAHWGLAQGMKKNFLRHTKKTHNPRKYT